MCPESRGPWRRILWVVFPAYVALIVMLSLVARGPDLPGDQSDKLAHVAAYAIMTLLGMPLATSHRRRLLLVLAILALGGLLEGLQAFTAARQASVADVAANGIGTLGALLLLVVFMRVLRRPPDGTR